MQEVLRGCSRCGLGGSFSYEADYTMAAAVVPLLRGVTPDWQDRVIQDRAVVPIELRHLLTAQGLTGGVLPKRWDRVSSELAPILGPLLLADSRFEIRRTALFEKNDIESAPSLERFLRTIGAAGRADVKAAIIKIMCQEDKSPAAKNRYPDFSSGAPSGLAALESAFAEFDRRYGYVGGEVVPKLELDLLKNQSGYDDEELEAFLRELYTNLCLDELRQLIDQASSVEHAGNNAHKQHLLERVNFLYPFFHPGLYERAIVLDETGQSQAAADYVSNAIIIDPQEHMQWHSLGVILNRLGSRNDANIAFAMSKIIEAADKGGSRT